MKSVLSTKFCSNDQLKELVMGWALSAYGKGYKYTYVKKHLFKILKRYEHSQHLGVYMMKILKMILKKHIVAQDRGQC